MSIVLLKDKIFINCLMVFVCWYNIRQHTQVCYCSHRDFTIPKLLMHSRLWMLFFNGSVKAFHYWMTQLLSSFRIFPSSILLSSLSSSSILEKYTINESLIGNNICWCNAIYPCISKQGNFKGYFRCWMCHPGPRYKLAMIVSQLLFLFVLVGFSVLLHSVVYTSSKIHLIV